MTYFQYLFVSEWTISGNNDIEILNKMKNKTYIISSERFQSPISILRNTPRWPQTILARYLHFQSKCRVKLGIWAQIIWLLVVKRETVFIHFHGREQYNYNIHKL
jgi:hypothetical protein